MPVRPETIVQNNLVENFNSFLKENFLLKKNDHVLLAVSGGVDSVVMAHLFALKGINFGIAHCNFTLRGKESDLDEKFVQKMATVLKVKFHKKRFATERYAKQHGISIQMAARDLRYQWFDEVRRKFKYTLIATAHHKDDQLETVLLNLARGTGIHGLTGIPEKSGKVIRPLLFATKKELIDFARKFEIEWREDASNEQQKYYRNKIRMKAIPVLEEINPSLEKGFMNTLQKLKTVRWVYDKFLSSLKSEILVKKNRSYLVDKKRVEAFGENAKILLFEILKDFGFNLNQIRNLFDNWNTSGRMFYSDAWKLVDDRKFLIIDRKAKSEVMEFVIREKDKKVITPQGIFLIDRIRRPRNLRTDKKVILLDYDKLKYPLVLRHWKAGDKFQPLGMKGKKKLSDFMIDEKIPVNLKERAMVLESKNGIIWVVGMRPDDRFKVRPESKQILKVTYISDDQSF